jgi:broad specificity phosphatase PhoE
VTLCLLVRHAAHDLLGKVLVGRTPGIGLSEAGLRQAHELGRALCDRRISRVQSSPRLRAIETAAEIAAVCGVGVQVCSALDEMEFGAWTGLSFAELEHDQEWVRWNTERSKARPPGGETMAEAQARVLAHIIGARAVEADGCIVMVTHAEIIRAALLHTLALPLDAWAEVEVAPAAVIAFKGRGQSSRSELTGGAAAA